MMSDQKTIRFIVFFARSDTAFWLFKNINIFHFSNLCEVIWAGRRLNSQVFARIDTDVTVLSVALKKSNFKDQYYRFNVDSGKLFLLFE